MTTQLQIYGMVCAEDQALIAAIEEAGYRAEVVREPS